MKYELLYIIPATMTDAEVNAAKEEVSALIAKYGEESTRDELLGKLKLAYPINGIRYGHYVLSYFSAEPKNIHSLDEELRHSRTILRHMVVTTVEGADKKEVKLTEYSVPETDSRRRTPRPGEKRRTETSAPKRTEEEVQSKVKEMSNEQLEEQIDKILDSGSEKL